MAGARVCVCAPGVWGWWVRGGRRVCECLKVQAKHKHVLAQTHRRTDTRTHTYTHTHTHHTRTHVPSVSHPTPQLSLVLDDRELLLEHLARLMKPCDLDELTRGMHVVSDGGASGDGDDGALAEPAA